MGWLIGLAVWVIFLNLAMKPNKGSVRNAGRYMTLCAVAIILIMGLRSRDVGSSDTLYYCYFFDRAKIGGGLWAFLQQNSSTQSILLLSEVGFRLFTWVAARIFPEAQWFILLNAVIVVSLTARFIWKNSENYCVSWIVFICLGALTFAMNGLRQALGMSICLVAYEYAKQRRLGAFVATVLVAMLFHKSAMFFSIVYVIGNMKWNWKNVLLLLVGIVAFLALTDRLILSYDSLTGEDYAYDKSAEGGGSVTIMIYAIAIAMALMLSKRLDEQNVFVPFVLTCVGLVLYVGRFLSVQILERMSYYFFYFLMILYPAIFNDLKPKDRVQVRFWFEVMAILLFAYRLGRTSFSDFTLFW